MSDQNGQRKKLRAFIGACTGVAVLTICLISANNRLAQIINDTTGTTVQVMQVPNGYVCTGCGAIK